MSLRTLMLLVLILGGGIGWKANRAHRQRRAVEAIKAINGNVAYDFQFTSYEGPGAGFGPRKEPSAPKWVRNFLGDEYFQEVTMVDIRSAVSDEVVPVVASLDCLVHLGLNGSKLGEPVLAEVAKLPRLQSLVLSQATLTDAGLASLSGAKRLRRLSIHGAAGVTDSGMASLAGLPDLRSVEIFVAPSLTWAGLKNLGPRLAELETLVLYQTAVTDEGMDCLDACRKLKRLSLAGAKISDAGFDHFRRLDSLRTLVVNSTGVTDQGMAGLEPLVGLETLSLGETKVTDRGLDNIRKLTGLKSVMLQRTQVSAEAIAELQAQRPTLRIGYGPNAPARATAPPTDPTASK